MKVKRLTVLFLIVFLSVSGYFVYSLFFNGENPEDSNDDHKVVKDITTVEILCAGDVMYHSSQLDGARRGDGSYEFYDTYKYVEHYIKQADLSIFNLETTFSGPPYTGYPSFSTPDNLAETLKGIGFDVVSTSNNHVNDRGIYGIDRTLEVLRKAHFVTTGSRDKLYRQRWAQTLIKGIQIGTLAYTYQTPSTVDRVSINGSFVNQETADRLNSFSYEFLERDIGKISEQVRLMKESGVEIVVLFLHFGEEYQLKANMWQRRIVDILLENPDIDVIFGSHPHNLQEFEIYYDRVPVFYSLGNYISNQRAETLANKYTETGAMARVTFTYDRGNKEIVGVKAEAVPTWVEKYYKDGRDNYYIIPLDESVSDNPELSASGHLARALDAKSYSETLLTRLKDERVIKEEAEEDE